MFSTPSQYTNYKIRGNPDIFTTLITDYITLVTVLYLAT